MHELILIVGLHLDDHVHCTLGSNFCHEFMIVSTAINFGLIHRGIARFKGDC